MVTEGILPILSDSKAFISLRLQHNFLLLLHCSPLIAVQLHVNIHKRSIIIALRLWCSFLCSRVFLSMIPFRLRTPQTSILIWSWHEGNENPSVFSSQQPPYWISPCPWVNWANFCLHLDDSDGYIATFKTLKPICSPEYSWAHFLIVCEVFWLKV